MIRKALYILVILIGGLQIIGWISGIRQIRSLGAAWCSSPLPIVFTEVKGVETFASNFTIRYTVSDSSFERKITPEVYNKLEGPYNRRNVYGAAISYGPVLPEKLWKSVLNYGICNGTLRSEINIPEDAENVNILIQTRTANRNDTWVLNIDCP